MKTKIESKLILAIDYVLVLVVDASTRDYKKELDGHLENISVQILSCPSRSIFSVAEVQQEEIESEGELQVRERGISTSPRVQEKSRSGSAEEGCRSLAQALCRG